MLDARPYQAETVKKAVDYAAENPRGRLLVVCPPGGGKTLIAAMMMRTLASERGLRGIAWAHRRELVGQMRDHLIESGIPREMIGVVMAGDKRSNPDAPIQVGSVDTLRHRAKPHADFVVSDEAHRDASDGRRKLRALYPDAFHCGFTATPVRLDGRGLRAEYDEMIIAAQPSELIAKGWLAALDIYTVPDDLLPDLRGVKEVGGDFEQKALESVTNKSVLVGNSVEHWRRHAQGRRTVAFPVGIKHSRAVVERFHAAGIAAEHLDGSMPIKARRDVLYRLERGELSVVSSCGVLSEGVDIPSVKCVMMLRPTKSLAMVIQQAGRAMRPWRDVTPLLLDHAGNCVRHKSAPHDDRPWELTHKSKTGASAATIKTCRVCFSLVPASCIVCPKCNGAFRVMNRNPQEEDGDLVPYVDESKHVRAFAVKYGMSERWAAEVLRIRGDEKEQAA